MLESQLEKTYGSIRPSKVETSILILFMIHPSGSWPLSWSLWSSPCLESLSESISRSSLTWRPGRLPLSSWKDHSISSRRVLISLVCAFYCFPKALICVITSSILLANCSKVILGWEGPDLTWEVHAILKTKGWCSLPLPVGTQLLPICNEMQRDVMQSIDKPKL